MTCKVTKLAAAGALLVCTTASAALAGSVTQPGETVGVPAGAPAAPGLYFINTLDWGCRNTAPDGTCVGVTIPVVEWATPWTIFGGRLQFLAATPAVEVGVHHTNYLRGMYNPLFGGMLAWDLGNGFNFSYFVGSYFDVHTEVAWSSTSLNQRFAFTYAKYGWNLTANVIWGIERIGRNYRPARPPSHCRVAIQTS
jgi:Putative MetA-pathway of phenol degradation